MKKAHLDMGKIGLKLFTTPDETAELIKMGFPTMSILVLEGKSAFTLTELINKLPRDIDGASLIFIADRKGYHAAYIGDTSSVQDHPELQGEGFQQIDAVFNLIKVLYARYGKGVI